MKLLFAILFTSTLSIVAAQSTQVDSPTSVLNRVLIALGTDQKISAIKNIQLSGYGHRNLLEQSERYQGPYIPAQITFKLSLDFEDTVGLFEQKEKMYTFQSNTRYVMDGEKIAMKMRGKTFACPQDQLIMDDLHLNPLRMVQKALYSQTLKSVSDTIVQNSVHHRVQFLWKSFPVRISINSNTDLPTMVEIQKPYSDNYLEVWGDIKKVILYSFWDVFDNGVKYPRQKDIYFNGNLWESTLITDLKYNQPIGIDSLRIPSETKNDIANISKKNRMIIQKMMDAKKEIAPGIWLIPGFCNTTFMQQNDQITIIESPNTSLNMEMIFDQAALLFPKGTIKQIVTTSDAWLHLGGIRASVNRATVLALKENKEIIETLLKANHATVTDAWQTNVKKKSVIKYIDKRTGIGNGVNRMELIPYRTESGEHMMMVYFPEYKLVYASDLLQPGNWQREYSLEVIKTIKREKIVVENIYAMHMEPISYAELLKQMEGFLPSN